LPAFLAGKHDAIAGWLMRLSAGTDKLLGETQAPVLAPTSNDLLATSVVVVVVVVVLVADVVVLGRRSDSDFIARWNRWRTGGKTVPRGA